MEEKPAVFRNKSLRRLEIANGGTQVFVFFGRDIRGIRNDNVKTPFEIQIRKRLEETAVKEKDML